MLLSFNSKETKAFAFAALFQQDFHSHYNLFCAFLFPCVFYLI